MRTRFAILLACAIVCCRSAEAGDHVLLEAEVFHDCGGWVVDQQFMDQMGSPYLLAHGLGDPVRDAVTTTALPAAGKYRVWVRTRDWVRAWKSPGAPGRFQVLIDGKPLAPIFGTEGAAWHWQDGGVAELGRQARVALHDLTGFEGRCDALLLSSDLDFRPPNDLAAAGQAAAAAAGPAGKARARRAATTSWWSAAGLPAPARRCRRPGWG